MTLIGTLVDLLPKDIRKLFVLGLTVVIFVQIIITQKMCPCGREFKSGKMENKRTVFQSVSKTLFGSFKPTYEFTDNPPPPDFGIILTPGSVCKEPSSIDLLIYFHSKPENAQRRKLLRRTWANKNLFLDKRVRTVFLVGLPEDPSIQESINKENSIYEDIVQGNFMDSYKNLTYKGLLGLKWASKYCPNAKFILKADDDAFVNIFKILEIIRSDYQEKMNSFVCALWQDNAMPILRNPQNCMKWCVDEKYFPGQKFFPRYCAGISFVLPTAMAPLLLNASRTTPFFWIDDVYITGVLPKKVPQIKYKSILDSFKVDSNFVLKNLQNNNTDFIMTLSPNEDQMNRLWTAVLRTLSVDWLKQINIESIREFMTFTPAGISSG